MAISTKHYIQYTDHKWNCNFCLKDAKLNTKGKEEGSNNANGDMSACLLAAERRGRSEWIKELLFPSILQPVRCKLFQLWKWSKIAIDLDSWERKTLIDNKNTFIIKHHNRKQIKTHENLKENDAHSTSLKSHSFQALLDLF